MYWPAVQVVVGVQEAALTVLLNSVMPSQKTHSVFVFLSKSIRRVDALTIATYSLVEQGVLRYVPG
jgi:hypothetical protein